jgi:hypothetical protein
MAMQRTFLERAQSITGIALVALGIFIFHENLGQAANQLSHLLGTTPGEMPGALPSLILTAARVVHAYAAGHQRFLHALLHQVLASSWPLLLVAVGATLSRQTPTCAVEALPKRDCALVDLTAGRSTLQ